MARASPLSVMCFAIAAAVVAGGQPSAAAPAPRYVTKPVVMGDIEQVVTALGSIEPSNYVDVGAQVSGQLQSIRVAIGDLVAKGELLAQIDPAIYQARVDSDQALLLVLQAQIVQKQAARRLLDRQLARQKEMFAGRAASQETLDTTAAAIEQNDAEVAALRAQVKQAQSSLNADVAALRYTDIRAPMAGTVVSLTAREGQTLNATQTAPTLLRIADLATMTVWSQVSEADIPQLKEGLPVYFTTLGRPGRRWTSTLRQILPSPEVINNVVLYDALFDIANDDLALLPRMSAQVYFVLRSAHEVPIVPLAVLQNMEDEDGVAAVVEVLQAGKPKRKTVEVGVRNRAFAEIRSGLRQGEQVIIPPPPRAPESSLISRLHVPHA